MVQHIRIGDMLVSAGFVTEEQVQEALVRQRETGRRLGAELLELGFVSEVQFTQVLSNQLSVPWVSLAHVQFSRDLLNLIPSSVAQEHGIIPIYVRHVRKAGDTLFVAMQDPTDEDALEAVVGATGMPVKPMVAPPSEIGNAIRVYYLGARARRASELAPAPPPAPAAPPPTPDASNVSPAPSAQPAAEEPSAAPGEEQPTEAESEPRAAEPVAAEQGEDGEWAPESERPPSPAEEASSAPPVGKPASGGPRMITLTLLDGTTVRLPAPGGGGAAAAEEEEENQALTALDLIHALQARAHGEDVGDVLPDERWELLFSSLLTLLIKKGLLSDWEFVEEWERQRGE